MTEALHSKGASSSASAIRRSAEAIAEGKGFMNQVVRLRLHYDDDPVDLPHTVIVKLPSTDPCTEGDRRQTGTGPARSQVLSGSANQR